MLTKFLTHSTMVLLIVAVTAIALPVEAQDSKVTICHIPPDDPTTPRTINVSQEDVDEHLAHGDSLGHCDPPQIEVPYTCSSSALFYEKLFVRAGAKSPMKGTVDDPFSTVSAALAYAARNRLGAVEVQVAPGVYGPDSAVITRPTRIVGPGKDAEPAAELALSIDHRSTQELGIQGVLFRPNGLKPGLTVRTHVMGDDPGGHTALCNLEYDQIVGHAVAQVGGSISVDDVIVRNTRRPPNTDFLNVLSGTGFIFGGGLGGSIDALLENSFVFDSEGTGIVASGFRTTVTLNAVALSGGQGCFGGLFVSNAAELFGTHVRIGGVRLSDDQFGVPVEGLDYVAGQPDQPIVLTGNRQFGLIARGTGVLSGTDTFVEISDLVVRNTFSTGSDAEECGFDAATNLAAGRGADIDIDQFILDASDLVGVQVDATGSIIFDEWFGSTVSLSNGVVSNHPIAVNIQAPDYPLATLQNNVAYVNNTVGLDAELISVPEPEQDLDSL